MTLSWINIYSGTKKIFNELKEMYTIPQEKMTKLCILEETNHFLFNEGSIYTLKQEQKQ